MVYSCQHKNRKIEKYKKVSDSKIQKQIKLGKNPSVDTIVFADIANTYSAFLIQNMFPVTLDYIESQYIKNKVVIIPIAQAEPAKMVCIP